MIVFTHKLSLKGRTSRIPVVIHLSTSVLQDCLRLSIPYIEGINRSNIVGNKESIPTRSGIHLISRIITKYFIIVDIRTNFQPILHFLLSVERSEERRVGKECVAR